MIEDQKEIEKVRKERGKKVYEKEKTERERD